jgi:hypothetical protein
MRLAPNTYAPNDMPEADTESLTDLSQLVVC